MMSLAQTIKHLKNTITNYTNFINSKSIENFATTKIVNYINGTEGGAKSIRNMIKNRTFKNLPPKIGYFNETTVPLIANFNMSINADAPWVISDDQGRELMYFPAKGSPTDSVKVFRAYRMSTGSGFIYENEPIIPGYLENDGKYLTNIRGLGNQYMVAITTGGRVHIINTFGEPDTWTLEADITDLYNSVPDIRLSVIYFKEYGTIYIPGTVGDGHNIGGRLYKVSTGELIKTDKIFDFVQVIGEQNSNIKTMYAEIGDAAAVYNEATSEMAWLGRSYIQWYNSDNSVSANYHSMLVLCDCPKEHFMDGRGTLVNKIPNSEYKIQAHKRGLCPRGDSGMRHATYDSMEKVIRTVYRYQSSDSIDLFTRSATSSVSHACDYFLGGLVTSGIQSSDAAPWAKRMMQPVVYNDDTYLYGISKKYGGQRVHVDFAIDGNGLCNITAGTWWLSGSYGDCGDLSLPLISCVKTGDSSKFYYTDDSNIVREVRTESFTADNYVRNGRRYLVDTDIKAPSIPTGYFIKSRMYNPKWNKWFFISEKSGTALVGDTFLLEYDIATGAWTEHWDERPQSWLDAAQASLSSLGNRSGCSVSSNAFIDDDGTMYFRICFNYIGGAGDAHLIKLTRSGTNYTMTPVGGAVMSGTYASNHHMFGWNNKYHYFFAWGSVVGTTESRIYSTRHWGDSPDKPNGAKSLFEDGDYYTWRFVCASATGMVCYLQDTPVFLGGYFSTVPAKEIPLKPNSANYIYFHRNSDDYKVVDVEVTQSPRNDVDGFNRIYLTKVVTNADGPVSQEYNQIDNYHKRK